MPETVALAAGAVNETVGATISGLTANVSAGVSSGMAIKADKATSAKDLIL